MNAKELIESGIIELYCLGIASKEEKLLVEQLAEEDLLLKEEIAAVNDALANYAVSVSSVSPPQNLKQKILSSIQSPVSTALLSNFPPILTSKSTTVEWFEYLAEQNIKEPEEHDDVLMIELPGTEDFYTYLVFGKPGGIVGEETHFGHDEYLLICEGECEMTIAGKKLRYKTGDFLTITPGTPHSAIVTGTQRMIVIGQRRAA